VLQAAKRHEHFAAIYFPHNLDFRGRAYPMPPHLNHMGNDLCRGLLTFSEARPLGPCGFRWLLIHLANLYGTVNKRPFDERVAWALQNLPEVFDSARAPLGGRRWWLQGEAPWGVLATCIELERAVASGDIERFESRLPVHQDGSCNGLQHYAAIGRDIPGAHAVGLIDAPEPQDVYSKVMEDVRRRVAENASKREGKEVEIAKLTLPEVNRKLVKQTVMTTVYGVTQYGARDQNLNRCEHDGYCNLSEDTLCFLWHSVHWEGRAWRVTKLALE
jgi:DNA-directed RNA polymerase